MSIKIGSVNIIQCDIRVMEEFSDREAVEARIDGELWIEGIAQEKPPPGAEWVVQVSDEMGTFVLVKVLGYWGDSRFMLFDAAENDSSGFGRCRLLGIHSDPVDVAEKINALAIQSRDTSTGTCE